MSTNKRYRLITGFVISGAAFIFLLFCGFELMGKEDMTAFLQWWLALLVLGIGFMPLTMFMFRYFKDKGWLFSKAIGLAVSGWLMWYLASCRILKFTVTNCFIITAVCFILNILFFVLMNRKYKNSIPEQNPYGELKVENLLSAFITELMFFTAFLVWTYLRCFKPEIMGNTEKFMDYGLMASIDNAAYMPAEDMWLAGETINYYYLGQYLSVFIKRLSGVDLEDSYNLALMMLAGFAYAMPYSLMSQVARDFTRRRVVNTKNSKEIVVEKGKFFFAPLIGVLSGLAVCFAGNMHYTIIAWVALKVPFVKNLLSITRDFYWFPDATRYIGYTPETNDKTIHEFPSYSFILGDLHAHVLNIMFVLTVMALLYTILQYRRKRMDALHYGIESDIVEFKGKEMFLKEVFQPQILVIGFFIGFFHMTNYWDFPIYFVVSGAVILFSNAVICRYKKETWYLTAAHAAVILVVSFIVSLPFTLTFNQISTGIAISLDHTPLYQLAVLWGLPITAVITFLVIMIKKMNADYKKTSRKKKKAASSKAASGEDKKEEHPILDWFCRMIGSLEITDLFVLTIGLCACGLILMPELIYVRDIYSGSYKRANTMFKLTYQAFIMFGMCMSYISVRMICFCEEKRRKIFGVVVVCLLATTLGYFFKASDSWFGDYKNADNYKGLDCIAFMEDKYPEDYDAVLWINENITEPSVIVEGVGYSYTYYERISATTGHATIIGWETHEWLWRSEAEFAKPDIIPERQEDVTTLYTSSSEEEVRAILEKYDVDYIYIGGAERYNGLMSSTEAKDGYTYNSADGRYYQAQEVNDELLRSLGEVIYQAVDENESIYDAKGEYRTYIVKVK